MLNSPTLESLAADLESGRTSARALVDECLAKIDDKNGEATCYTNIGQSYLQMGEIDKAVFYNNKALELQESLGDREGVAITMISIAEANAAQKNYTAALKELDEAMDTALKIGTPEVQKKVLENRAEIYSQMGDFRKAYEAHRRRTAAHLDARPRWQVDRTPSVAPQDA